MCEAVHRADDVMLLCEKRDLTAFAEHVWDWSDGYELPSRVVVPWSADESYRRFLERWNYLRGELFGQGF